jgi:hypothetical protein
MVQEQVSLVTWSQVTMVQDWLSSFLVTTVNTLCMVEANAKTAQRVTTALIQNFSLSNVNLELVNQLLSKHLALLAVLENGLYSANGNAISALKAICAVLQLDLLSSALTVNSQLREPPLAPIVQLQISS